MGPPLSSSEGGWSSDSGWPLGLRSPDSQGIQGEGVRRGTPGGSPVSLVVSEGVLYLLREGSRAITLYALAGLIGSKVLGAAFCWDVGVPFVPREHPWEGSLQRYPGLRL